MIDKNAIIDPTAKIAEDAHIGPWTMIGANVEIGSGTWVGPHVVINGPTRIGVNNKIYQFSSIGEQSQDKKFHGDEAYLEIGDNNVIREFCTLNRGNDGGKTSIGNNNLLMAYVHVAHDCHVGNDTIFANNAALAGHVTVEDYAILSGLSAVRQFVTIGQHSFIAGGTLVIKDVLPYVLISGNPAEPFGLNSVGLKRREFSQEVTSALKQAYKIIYRQNLTTEEAIEKLKPMANDFVEIQHMIDGLTNSELGIIR